jgi:hypothetical protein
MSIFSRKLNSDEYETILKRISDLRVEIAALKADFDSLRTNQNSLRGKLNIMVGGEKTISKEEDLNLEFPFRNQG